MASANSLDPKRQQALYRYLDDIFFCACVFPSPASVEIFKKIIEAGSHSFYDTDQVVNTKDFLIGFPKVVLVHIALFNDQPKTPDGFIQLCSDPDIVGGILEYMMDKYLKIAGQIDTKALIPDRRSLKNYATKFYEYVVGVYNRNHLFENGCEDFPKHIDNICGLPVIPGIQLSAGYAMLSSITGGRFTITYKQASKSVTVNDTIIVVYHDVISESTTGYLVTGKNNILDLPPVLVIVVDNLTFYEEILQYQQSKIFNCTCVAKIGEIYRYTLSVLEKGAFPAASIGAIDLEKDNIALKPLALLGYDSGEDDLETAIEKIPDHSHTELIHARNIKVKSTDYQSYQELTRVTAPVWSTNHTLFTVVGLHYMGLKCRGFNMVEEQIMTDPHTMWSQLIQDIFRSQFSDALDAKSELMEYFNENSDDLWWYNSNNRDSTAVLLETSRKTCLTIWGQLFASPVEVNGSIVETLLIPIMKIANANNSKSLFLVQKNSQRHLIHIREIDGDTRKLVYDVYSVDSVKSGVDIVDGPLGSTSSSSVDQFVSNGTFSDSSWWDHVTLM